MDIVEIQKRVELWELFCLTGLDVSPEELQNISSIRSEEKVPTGAFMEPIIIDGMGRNPATEIFNF